MKVWTVKELYEKLGEFIEEGKGERRVLIQNDDSDIDGAYRTIGAVEGSIDVSETCVYLLGNDVEEENEYWEKDDKTFAPFSDEEEDDE